ncbi:MAG: 23S rRNA (pseudouridine(1915)-N(3))-methyltransferase RlmH [Wenzhouxiangellaceae bacterium]|nr:23S rRNA (pseudouridine(1915)-N(3))-methyltransferase RlmH [Wenzhouxiangellaceae bacterium]
MQLRVIAVGRRMPSWVAEGWREYARRMPSHLPLELVEVEADRAAGDARAAEGAALAARCLRPGVVVALDGSGSAWTTQRLAGRLEDWQMNGDPVQFLVGGADGHAPELLETADLRWSLGPLTLPHMLVRVILAEQLYRATSILSGHPYHRD